MISKEQVTQQQEKGISLFKKKKYSEAIECFTKAISSCSYDTALYASTLYRRAVAYEEIGKLELALKDYSKALKIAPSHKQAQSKLDTYCIPEVQLNQYSHAEMLVALQQEINKLPNKTAITEIENQQHDKQRLLFIKACLDFLQALPFPVGNDNFPELSPKQHIFLDCYLTHQATEVYKAIGNSILNLSGKTRGEYRSFLLQYTITWEMLEHMTKVVDHGVPDENVLIPLRSTAPELKECFIRLAWEYSSNMNISDAALPDILKHDIPGLIKIFDYILIGNVEEKKPDGLKPLLAIRTVSKLVLDLDSLVNLLRISSRMESQYDYKDLDAGVITDFRHENFSSIFDNSLIHQHAFLRKLQKIGELFTNKNLSKSTKDLDSSTDWEIFVNIRDAITHQDEGSNKYNVRKLLGWSKDKIKEVIEQIEQGFFARIIRLIWTRDQTLPTKFYATDFDDGENNAVEFWQAHYQQILDKSTEDSYDPQKMRVSGEELKLFIATLREQLPSQEEVFFQFWQDLLDGSSDTPNKQVLGKMFKPIADLKATHAEKVSVLKGIKDKALTKPTISKADRKSQRDTEDVDKVKRAQEDEEGLDYKGLEKIQELRDLLKNSTGTVINNLGRLESAIESLNNIKRFLEQHEFIRENFDYRSLQEWEEAHADKQKVLQFFATMIADPELRDAIEYNAGQLLQNLESLNFPVWFGGNLLSDDFYEPLRLLRNYIEHGNHIIDARPYIPGRSADILDYKSQIIGPAMMKLIIEFLPKLEMESTHQDLYVSFSSASEAEPYMVLGYLES